MDLEKILEHLSHSAWVFIVIQVIKTLKYVAEKGPSIIKEWTPILKKKKDDTSI